MQEVILKRAADTLETVLYGSRPPGHVATSGPLNHINPMYYPKSPAFITPTAIFTSQGLTPTRFGPSFPAGALVSPGKFIHGQPPGAYHLDTRKGDVEGGSTSGVSRCSSNETVIQQSMDSSTNPAYFTFPQQAPEGMVDIKHEHGIAAAQPGGIHKPKPLTPAGFYSAAVAMPFVQVHPAHSQGASYMGNPSMGFHMSDLGNGGSASFMNQINPNDGSNRNNNNSVASMTHNFPLFIPPSSTGFLMAPTGTYNYTACTTEQHKDDAEVLLHLSVRQTASSFHHPSILSSFPRPPAYNTNWRGSRKPLLLQLCWTPHGLSWKAVQRRARSREDGEACSTQCTQLRTWILF